jgi:hypothetical protein
MKDVPIAEQERLKNGSAETLRKNSITEKIPAPKAQ